MTDKLAALIKLRRIERKLTQDDLARLAGVSRDTIIEMEKGQREHGFGVVTSVLVVLGITTIDVRTCEPVTMPKPGPALSPEGSEWAERFEGMTTRQRRALTDLMATMVAQTEPGTASPSPNAAPKKSSGKR